MSDRDYSNVHLDDHLVIVAPVFNDWKCAEAFVSEVSELSEIPRKLTILLVDDGSTDNRPPTESWTRRPGLTLSILSLEANLGHQKAIAAGLIEVSRLPTASAVVVADVDGEDRPSDIVKLWHLHLADPQALVVARRRRRSEDVRFRVFYRSYRFLFQVMTGQQLDFGNFSLIPGEHIRRICKSPVLSRHYPSTLLRSRVPLVRVPIDRGARYSGRSQINFMGLINHGLSGIAAFSDVVYARLLAASAVSVIILITVAVAGVAVRMYSGSALPGWLALLAAVAVLGLIQIVTTTLVVSFLASAVAAGSATSPSSEDNHLVHAISSHLNLDSPETEASQ